MRSLKCVLLKCVKASQKKARLNLTPFVWGSVKGAEGLGGVKLSGGLWRRLVSGGVKQKASARAVVRLGRELKCKAG